MELKYNEEHIAELKKDKENLAKIAEKQAENPSTQTIIQGENVKHTEIHVKDTTITATNGAVLNFGKINGAVTTTIQQMPDNQNELKQLLIQLQALIEKSELTIEDKSDALKQVQDLAQISQQPAAEQKSKVRTTLRYFKGIAEEAKDIIPIVTEIGHFFGF